MSTEFRSFTIRVPIELYMEISDAARADGVFLTHKATQLLRIGLNAETNMSYLLARLIKEEKINE